MLAVVSGRMCLKIPLKSSALPIEDKDFSGVVHPCVAAVGKQFGNLSCHVSYHGRSESNEPNTVYTT